LGYRVRKLDRVSFAGLTEEPPAGSLEAPYSPGGKHAEKRHLQMGINLMGHKSGFVNILGNQCRKVDIDESACRRAALGHHSKAQTTRHRIMGVLSGDDYQIVYSDTPGILTPSTSCRPQ